MRRAALALLCAASGTGLASCGNGTAPAAGVPQDKGPAAAPVADAGGLTWTALPEAYDIKELPGDRVVQGELRNDTGKPVDLRVDQVDVRDTDGKPLRISVRFAQAFGHALYGPGGPPAPLQASRYDQARLGERVTLPSGETQAITLAWREQRGAPAETVKISGYTLELPR